jgi:hypothetical protein
LVKVAVLLTSRRKPPCPCALGMVTSVSFGTGKELRLLVMVATFLWNGPKPSVLVVKLTLRVLRMIW